MIQSKHTTPPSWEYPKYEPGQPVALFIPCYIDQLYPQIGQATVKLLADRDVPIVFPEKQTCCGQPAFNSGYWDEARSVIRHFGRVFEEHQWIVCPSASCAAMARIFFEQAEGQSKAAEVGSRVFELTEFLVHALGVTEIDAHFPHKVTLHIGCHGRRELGLIEPPLTLLKSVRGIEYCELPDIEECCGFGGTFSVKMPGTSLAMGRSKAENILASGADVVASADVSCLMHIDGIMQRDPKMKHIRAMHISEVLVQREA